MMSRKHENLPPRKLILPRFRPARLRPTVNMFIIELIVLVSALILSVYVFTKDHRISQNMARMIQKLIELSHSTKNLSTGLSYSANEMTEATDQQTSAAQETAALMEEMTAMLRRTTDNATALENISKEADSSSQEGSQLITQVSVA